ncbi:hypothetical protein EPI10_020677 [Gossypium australe]|uniref:Uncharacterized protein n=1 Tax=Gossypium australe TaxID=47621 RepID=A0A5B6WGC2_9ROSI|nr:hypothetical protein EPI10_020677 [Gossypium australe]
MNRSRDTHIVAVIELERIIRRNHQQQQQQQSMPDPPLPAVGNVPRENPLFGSTDDNTLGNPPTPPQLPVNVHMACNERALKDYALPSLEMVKDNITRPEIIQMI